ncbi:hypothetical protein EDB83DRAFT_2344631 [Lactarius deliciosus]|nr:hypothetical protein EDB83DRAFT_2344631 [Lactarius deliciosus]
MDTCKRADCLIRVTCYSNKTIDTDTDIHMHAHTYAALAGGQEKGDKTSGNGCDSTDDAARVRPAPGRGRREVGQEVAKRIGRGDVGEWVDGQDVGGVLARGELGEGEYRWGGCWYDDVSRGAEGSGRYTQGGRSVNQFLWKDLRRVYCKKRRSNRNHQGRRFNCSTFTADKLRRASTPEVRTRDIQKSPPCPCR